MVKLQNNDDVAYGGWKNCWQDLHADRFAPGSQCDDDGLRAHQAMDVSDSSVAGAVIAWKNKA